MLYELKRYFLYQSKIVENHLRTWRKQREIAQAYRPDLVVSKRLPAGRLVKLAVGVCLCAGIIVSVVIYQDRLLYGVGKIRKSITSTLQSTMESIRIMTAVTQKAPDTSSALRAEAGMEGAPVPVQNHRVDSLAPRKKVKAYPDDLRNMLIVNKMEKKMFLLSRKNTSWFLVRSFDIAVGVEQGQKVKAGDRRTPEGIYFIVGRKENTELSTIYGPLAFILNYPNRYDRLAGRTGQGIWIHGTNPDSTPVNTRGCVEMHNGDIYELGRLFKTGIGTPVYIINQPALEDPVAFPDYQKVVEERAVALAEYEKLKEVLTAVVLNWKSAWESRDIERYAGFYKTDIFSGQGLTWDEWREKKERTFSTYTTITITIDNITLVDFSESSAVVAFKQGYASDQVRVDNGKRLTLVKESGEWKISKETTFPKEELLL